MSRNLDDWLTAYLQRYDNSEPCELYRKWVGLSVIAGALQRKCYLEWEDRKYPNLYTVLAGPSGGARKGTAMKQGMTFLEELGVAMAPNSTTRAQLVRRLKEAEADDTDRHGTIIRHASLTVFSKELTVFLSMRDPDMIEDLTDWYDCDPEWTRETATQGKWHVRGVFVNLLGATTPTKLQLAFPMDLMGGGLASRMFFVYAVGKGKIVFDPRPTQEELDLHKDLMIDLGKIHALRGEFEITSGAVDRLRQIYEDQEKAPIFSDPRLTPYVDRRITHLQKVAMCLSASEGDSMQITEQTFNRALRTLLEMELFVPRVFWGFGRSEQAPLTADVERTIRARRVIGYGDLVRLFLMETDLDGLDKIVKKLERAGMVKKAKDRESGEVVVRLIGGE